MFVEGFSASTDVFNRALPLLGLIFLGELLGAGQLDWTWWQNVLAVLGGVAVVPRGSSSSTSSKGGRPARSGTGSARPSSRRS